MTKQLSASLVALVFFGSSVSLGQNIHSEKTPQREDPSRIMVDYHQQSPDRELWSAKIEQDEPLELFNRRILPLLKAESNSCSQCHFAGVDLKSFIRPNQSETFALLNQRGLLDVQHPDKSKILEFIARTAPDTSEIQKRVRVREFQAFRAWIHQAVADPELLRSKVDERVLGTEIPREVIRHARRDRVLQSFVDNVWSQMGRCISCHSPDRNQRVVKKNGEEVSWIVPHDPAATLEKLLETGNIDLDSPDDSPVLTKPTGLEEHGGHVKFTLGSQADKGFRRFLNDYAAIMNDKYKTIDELPEPPEMIAVPSRQFLRIVDVPKDFNKKLLRVELYPWVNGRWSKQLCGHADNPINSARWQSMIFSAAPTDSLRATRLREDPQLLGGPFLVKIYVDREGKVIKNRDYQLAEDELAGKIRIDGIWQQGFKTPKVVSFPKKDQGRDSKY